jgi:Transglutaminase-like superfamily
MSRVAFPTGDGHLEQKRPEHRTLHALMSASYFLSPHVHVCVAGRQVILLDLERDKYLAVAHAHPVGRWVRGWPSLASAPAAAVGGTEPSAEPELLTKMISQGLLVTDAAVGKEAAPVVAREPQSALVEYDLNVQPRASLGHLWHLFTAFAAAKWSLKCRPIKDVVEATRLRKARAPLSPVVDVAALRPLVASFIHLRPLFFTARQACLLDSLTLIHFLARYGAFPDWVFGVKTDPFYAHCWVQQGDFVFNDTPDYIRAFSPILVV